MWKRIVSFILALLLCMLCLPVVQAEDSDWIDMEPILLSAFDLSAYEWYETATTRTLLAVFATLDCILADHTEFQDVFISALEEDEVYVAKDGTCLVIFFFGEDSGALFLFEPSSNRMALKPLEIPSSLAALYLSAAETQDMFSSYYHIDAEDFIDASLEVAEWLEE